MSRDVVRMFADIDRMVPERFLAHLTPDVVFRFGNALPVTGHAAVGQAVAAFFARIDGMKHHILNVWEHGDTVIVQIDIDYRRKDGRTVTVPNVDILTYRADLVRDWRIYIDAAPVFA